jgi:hypothetical protein
LEYAPLFLSPLADPTLGTDCRHDAEKKKKKTNKNLQKKSKNILVRSQQKFGRKTAENIIIQSSPTQQKNASQKHSKTK